MHTVGENIEVVPMLKSAVRTSQATSAVVDTSRKAGTTIAVVLSAHDRGTGDEVLTVKVQDSDDGTNFSDITGASVAIGDVTPDANKGTVFLITVAEHRRYLRVVATPSGTTPSDEYAILGLFEATHIKPAPQDQDVVGA